MLEKFRVAPADNPERTPREEARLKIVEARKARTAEREAARIQREKALVEQEAREAERLAEEQRAAAELSAGTYLALIVDAPDPSRIWLKTKNPASPAALRILEDNAVW
jgi:hypothetical protein